MESLAKLPAGERKVFFEEASARIGLPDRSVEKDFWVCWTLLQLFEHSSLAEHLTFKGGTSLSKVWKIIERFSEDIDLIISREFLGFGGADDPGIQRTKKGKKRAIEALKKECSSVVCGPLLTELLAAFASKLPSESWKLEVDRFDRDQQTLLFYYPTCWPEEAVRYVAPAVMGARSDDFPSGENTVSPYVAEVFPKQFLRPVACVRVLAAERTFWEKATLLHEETYRPDDKNRKVRMARHYYDLWCLIERGIAERAACDVALLRSVVEHRGSFFPYSWVDYGNMKKGSLRVSPLSHQTASWRKDYEQMQGEMFFGEVPNFDAILATVQEWEKRFNG